jgi:hypothetical protein
MVQSQPRQIVHKTLCQKNLSQKRAAGVAQGESPEFKPQYRAPPQKKYIYKIVFLERFLCARHLENILYIVFCGVKFSSQN